MDICLLIQSTLLPKIPIFFLKTPEVKQMKRKIGEKEAVDSQLHMPKRSGKKNESQFGLLSSMESDG